MKNLQERVIGSFFMVDLQSKSIIFGKVRFFCILFSFLLVGLGESSCGKKIFPSGLEGNLEGNQREFARNERKRKRTARRANRKTARLERKAQRPMVKQKKKSLFAQKKMQEEHVNKQTPEVQERMKQNRKDDKKRNKPNKTFWQRLMFWKKSSCNNGS